MNTLRVCFKVTLPILFGYLPLSITFGVLFQSLGYHWIYAALMGLIVYAGASQLIATGMIAAGASVLEIAITTFLINARHLFYGISLLKKFDSIGLRKLYKAFTLTDETYSLITSMKAPDNVDSKKFYFCIGCLNHVYWTLGCLLGALIGKTVELNTQGMDFVLTAVFTVLLIEQYKTIKEFSPFTIATICGTLAIILFKDQAFLVSIALALSLLLIKGRMSQWN